MFDSLYQRIQHGSYLKSEDGIKQYAEKCMGQLINKVTKKSAFYREQDENLLVEKANLRLREEELREKPVLDAGDFFSVRRRLWFENFTIGAVVLAAVFINYTAVTAFLSGGTIGLAFLHWVVAATLAVVLTGGGLVITERLIETAAPREDQHATEEISDAQMSSVITTLWTILLIGIEIAIMGLAEVRASMLAQAQDSSFLYLGYIAAAMLLPLVAGALRWDSMRYLDIYKSTRAIREIESRLAQIDSTLRQNEEYESNFYKVQSITYWDRLNEFKTYKRNYDESNGHAREKLPEGHFARTYDAFQNESYKRYTADLRDVRSTSVRRLELMEDATAGAKSGKSKKQPMPVSPKGDEGEKASGEKSSSEESPSEGSSYQDVQSVR
jgi:hypothetical protein